MNCSQCGRTFNKSYSHCSDHLGYEEKTIHLKLDVVVKYNPSDECIEGISELYAGEPKDWCLLDGFSHDTDESLEEYFAAKYHDQLVRKVSAQMEEDLVEGLLGNLEVAG